MKQYTLYFSKPVAHTYTTELFNKETKSWEEATVTEMVETITFSSLTLAKKFIKANLDKFLTSSITKTWANGDWENLGEIKLHGSNKTFVANTRQKKENY